MRILYCVNSLGARGGIERVTIVKANALADIEGNQVAICYTDKGDYPHTIHPLSSKIQVFDLNTPYWQFTSPLKILKSFIPTVIATRKALKRLIRSFRPDVVVSTGSYEKFALASLSVINISWLWGGVKPCISGSFTLRLHIGDISESVVWLSAWENLLIIRYWVDALI